MVVGEDYYKTYEKLLIQVYEAWSFEPQTQNNASFNTSFLVQEKI